MTPADIKQARLALGLSQTEMCRALGLTSVMTYAKWEQGTSKPTSGSINAVSMLAFLHRHGLLREWLAQQTPSDSAAE
ncbi:helix-turn-helix domain-containing protein [Aeromonas veronii]